MDLQGKMHNSLTRLSCKVTSCKNYDCEKGNCSLDEVVLEIHSGYTDNSVLFCINYVDVSPRCHRCRWANMLSVGYRAECCLDGKTRNANDWCDNYEKQGE